MADDAARAAADDIIKLTDFDEMICCGSVYAFQLFQGMIICILHLEKLEESFDL